MIKIENPMGKMNISQNYFAELVGHAAQSCFGVTNMVPYSAYQGISSVLKKEMPNKGVKVSLKDDKLNIEVHVEVAYGININAVSESIISEVSYNVEKATNLKVARVDVYVDKISEE